MDSYEKRSNAYDKFFDKGMVKLERYEEKLDDDMHPDKKIKLYDDLMEKAFNFYKECLHREQMDPALYPNSDDAFKQWEYYQNQQSQFLDRYEEELSEWKEIEAEKRLQKKRSPRKQKNKKTPPATKEPVKKTNTVSPKEYGVSVQIYMQKLYARLAKVLRIAYAKKLTDYSCIEEDLK